MRNSLPTSLRPMLALLVCASITACGGGNGEVPSLPPASKVTMGGPAITDAGGTITVPADSASSTQAPATVQGGLVPTGGTAATLSAGTATSLSAGAAPALTAAAPLPHVTTVQLTSSASVPQVNTPVTFGQVFAQGDVKATDGLAAKTASGATVPAQVDVKARHADGSLRHAVITVVLPTSMPKQVQTIYLVKASPAAAATALSPVQLLNAGFSAGFSATVNGQQYTASADALLRSGKFTTWLSGSNVTEWLVSAPLKNAAGAEHPHLTARFAIRYYPATNSARVDTVIENGWAYEAGPQNFTYDAQLTVGGRPVYSKAALLHYHHARWRKVFWWGKEPLLTVRHNTAYLIASKAVANYDQTLVMRETALASWVTRWASAKTGPMETGLAKPHMSATGARPDIGLMPAWSASYLLSMDERLKNITLGMSEQAGSWSTHYRHKPTGRPVSLADFSYASTLTSGGDTVNPVTRKQEAFPACPVTVCGSPMAADTSHQPGFSYLPYIVTGDHFHLEELLFWTNWSSMYSNPGYRQGSKGLVVSDQIRGQAWSLRTLAEAAYITPDDDPQKALFTTIVNNNIDWYNATYTNNPDATKLGALTHGYAVIYTDRTALAPWQDDFFTAAVGHMTELGFTRAQPLLAWKSTFTVERMVGDGYCWVLAPIYALKVRDTSTAPIYTTIKQAYLASNTTEFAKLECASAAMASSLKLRVGEMVGYVTPSGTQGIMQAALAYSAPVNANGKRAWDKLMAAPFKPDYPTEPQFALVPRN